MLSLPRWATDCLKRAEPELAALDRPLALWERERGALRLAAVDRAAARRGLGVGQALSDARALVPDLELREIDRGWLAHMFGQFADWHSNASPLVAVLDTFSPYGDLGLDITGVPHLFGGEAAMLGQLVERLRALGCTVNGAIADTIGAAWALAHQRPGHIAAPGAQREAIAGLSVSALRLDAARISSLDQLGLKQVGQLYGRDRKALQARFGAELVLRLDQALGHAEERLTPRLPPSEFHADRRFAEPIGYIDDVLMTVRDLAVALAARLEAEGLGAQAFHLLLYRVDHKVMTLSVNAARATRDAAHVAQLFVHRSERLEGEYDPGFGIDMIRLAASSTSPLDSTQVGVFDTNDGAADLTRLFDRISSRLGVLAVVRSKPVDTHIPERAVVLEPVVAPTEDAPGAWPDPLPRRPARLLPRPEPIEVIAEVPHGPPMRMVWRRIAYRIARAAGPERIEAEWWRSATQLDFLVPSRPEATEEPARDMAKKPVVAPRLREHVSPLERFSAETTVRDYFIVEDDGGRRFWVFRVGLYGVQTAPNWYLHGFFS